jgi:NTE family protein
VASGRKFDEFSGYPSLAQIAGHAMSSIFLDGLSVDIERMARINQTLSILTPAQRQQTSLRPIEMLAITPSKLLDSIASQHTGSLPLPIRTLLSAIGATERRGAALASYLLFESSYTRSLIELGQIDTLHRREEVLRFFGALKPASRGLSTDIPRNLSFNPVRNEFWLISHNSIRMTDFRHN